MNFKWAVVLGVGVMLTGVSIELINQIYKIETMHFWSGYFFFASVFSAVIIVLSFLEDDY